MKIVPADQFTLEELADAYNQTRIDYIVPMPMTVDRLREYNSIYDIDLSGSCAVVEDNEIIGIGMLGVREGKGWITRLGVLPSGRRKGVGSVIMEFLLHESKKRHLSVMWLEVIKGNTPAHELFRNFGFVETQELFVTRRPPSFRPATGPLYSGAVASIRSLSHEKALTLLASRKGHCAWTNQIESMRNARNLTALEVKLKDGSSGWVSYHASLLQLTKIIVEVVEGDPTHVAATILYMLHRQHPTQDAIAENVPALDPKWPGFQEIGYFDAFGRIEMIKRF